MDSAVCEIASSVPTQALVEPTTRPPNAAATPTIACRRVGALASTARLFLSRIHSLQFLTSPAGCPRCPHDTTALKYVQHNIFLAEGHGSGHTSMPNRLGGLMPYP